MECIGINEYTGTVYEGRLHLGHRVSPAPVITAISAPALPVTSKPSGPLPPLIFREDFFDPISRVRRGRIYKFREGRSPRPWHVRDHLRQGGDTVLIQDSLAYVEEVILYKRCGLTADQIDTFQQGDAMVRLGGDLDSLPWKVVAVESNVFGTPVLTLRSMQSFGEVPAINPELLPEEIRSPLPKAVDAVINSNHRLGAVDTVDRVRDASAIIFGYLAGDRTLDLAKAVEKAQKLATERKRPIELLAHAGHIVARLHARGKTNEQIKRETLPLVEEDAQLAIACLGLVLRNVAWDK